jgi:hypothetical protein
MSTHIEHCQRTQFTKLRFWAHHECQEIIHHVTLDELRTAHIMAHKATQRHDGILFCRHSSLPNQLKQEQNDTMARKKEPVVMTTTGTATMML